MKIGCVIMAAGSARRFGSNKLLAPLAGKPLLSYILESFPRDIFSKTIAVVSDGQVAELCRSMNVKSLLYGGGLQSDTVKLGISEMMEMDACIFLLGDQPLLRSESIQKIIDAFCHDNGCVYRLAFDGVSGSPVIFPKSIFERLKEIEGDKGGMVAVKGSGIPVRTVTAEYAEELLDTDTAEDLRRLELYMANRSN